MAQELNCAVFGAVRSEGYFEELRISANSDIVGPGVRTLPSLQL